MTKNPGADDLQSGDVSDQAARSTLALNPLVGLRGKDLMDSTVVLFNAIAKEPAAAVNQWFSFLSEVGSIASGKSERKPEAGDKRFAKASSADGFLAEAEKKSGSWWLHWRDWLIERCGEEIPAPSKLGSACHPAGAPALGTYVFDW